MSGSKVHSPHPHTEYKDSGVPWLGKVLKNWQLRRIKTLFRESESRKGQRPMQPLSLTRAKGLIPQSENTSPTLIAEDLSAYKVCRPGDIVMNRMQAWTGMFAVPKQEGVVSPDYSVFSPTTHCEIKFFEHLFKTPVLVEQFAKASKGIGTGFNRLYWENFGSITVAVPPHGEQAAIVRYLDHADELISRYISAKERLIALLQEQRQAVIHQAVTCGLDPNVQLKSSNVNWLGDIPEHWERRRLKEVAAIQTGITIGANNREPELIERPYLRVANVQADRLDLSKVTTIRVSPAEIKRTTLQVGDVLMTEGGDIDKLGRGCIWQGDIPDCLHQNHVFAVRPDPASLRPEFLVAVMGSLHGRTYFCVTAKQTTNLASTNRTTLGNFPMYLPSAAEQGAIMNHIAQQCSIDDDAINKARRQIALINEYRTRLIADVVTGQIDVRATAVELPD